MAQSNQISIIVSAKDQASGVIGGMVSSFQSNMRTVAAQGAIVGASLTAFAKSSTDYLTGLVKSSKGLATQTGMTIEQSSTLIQAFHRLGLSADQADVTFRLFSKTIETARQGAASNALQTEQLKNKIDATKLSISQLSDEIKKNGDKSGELHIKLEGLNLTLKSYQEQLTHAAGPLAELNVATQNADGTNRSFNDILLNVADRFRELPNGTAKTTMALQLFGRSGSSMIKVLNQGSQGIKDLEEQAQKLGLTLNATNVGAIQQYIQSQKDLAETTNSMKIQVGTLTAPVMTRFNTTLNDTLQRLIGVNAPFREVTANVLAFGGPVASATAATAAFLGNVGSMPKLLSLASLGTLAINPLFLLLATVVIGAASAINQMHQELGSWSAVAQVIKQDLVDLGTRVQAFLLPSLVALLNTVRQDLMPTFVRLWHEVLEPLMPVLGVTLVGALRLSIDAFNLMLNVLIPVINFMLNNKGVVIGLATAFGVLALSMNFDAITAGFVARMAAVRASVVATQATIGSTVAFLGGPVAAAGWAGFAGAAIAAFVVIQNKANQTKAVLESVNNSIAADNATITNGLQSIINSYKSGKIDKATEVKLLNGLAASQGHALGTDFAPGGWTTLGERGPELVQLPTGSRVLPAKQTQQVMQQRASGGVTIGEVHVHNEVDERAFMRRLGFMLSAGVAA